MSLASKHTRFPQRCASRTFEVGGPLRRSVYRTGKMYLWHLASGETRFLCWFTSQIWLCSGSHLRRLPSTHSTQSPMCGGHRAPIQKKKKKKTERTLQTSCFSCSTLREPCPAPSKGACMHLHLQSSTVCWIHQRNGLIPLDTWSLLELGGTLQNRVESPLQFTYEGHESHWCKVGRGHPGGGMMLCHDPYFPL